MKKTETLAELLANARPLCPPTSYDYAKQAWVVNGRYVACAHPKSMDCRCFGRLHAGDPVIRLCSWCEDNGHVTPATHESQVIGGDWYPCCAACLPAMKDDGGIRPLGAL